MASLMNLFRTYPRSTLKSKDGKFSACAATKCWVCHQGKMRPCPICGNWLNATSLICWYCWSCTCPFYPCTSTPIQLLLDLCALLGKTLFTYIKSPSPVGPWPHGSCQVEAAFTIFHQAKKVTASRKGNLMQKYLWAPCPKCDYNWVSVW